MYNSADAPEMYYSHVKEPTNAIIFNSGMVMWVPFMEYQVLLLPNVIFNLIMFLEYSFT